MFATTQQEINEIIDQLNKINMLRIMTDATRIEYREKGIGEFYFKSLESANLAIKILQNNNYLITGISDDKYFNRSNVIVGVKL